MCSGRSSQGVKLTDCGAQKLIQTSCIWVTVFNYLSADCPAIPISSGSPRFSLKIFNTDQNERGIGKIRIFTSFCDDACLHRILIILVPEHHIECSQLKPIFQKLKKLQIVKSSTCTPSRHAKRQSDEGLFVSIYMSAIFINMVLSKCLVIPIAYVRYLFHSSSGFQ